MSSRVVAAIVFLFVVLTIPSTAWSHAMAPSLFKIHYIDAQQYKATWKQPIKQVQGAKLVPLIQGCNAPVVLKESIVNNGYQQELQFTCTKTNMPRFATVSGINQSNTYVLIEWVSQSGRASIGFIDQDKTLYELAADSDSTDEFIQQVKSGVSHLLIGYDHVLFILGLLLILRRSLRLLVIAFSCFTIGHTVSLFLSSMRVISINPAFIEWLILVSLIWMALEVLNQESDSRVSISRSPGLITFLFGLIHGFGFSNVLVAMMESDQNIVSQILAFNIGVELGQIIIVLVGYPLLWLLFKTKLWNSLNTILGYAIGGVSVYWMLQAI